jgi:hypothetical protein
MARELDWEEKDLETDINFCDIEYDFQPYLLEVASKIPIASGFLSMGYSYAFIYILEYAFLSSVGTLFETTKLTVPSSNNSTEIFLFGLISALWIAYPILAIKPYKKIIASGYRPRSIDYHVFTTFLIIIGTFLRYRYNLTSDSQNPVIIVITVILLFGGLSIKIGQYTELLRQEISESTS